MGKSTSHEDPHYVTLSGILLLPHSVKDEVLNTYKTRCNVIYGNLYILNMRCATKHFEMNYSKHSSYLACS